MLFICRNNLAGLDISTKKNGNKDRKNLYLGKFQEWNAVGERVIIVDRAQRCMVRW